MIKNERGSTLLVVMLMITVFTVLGLSILSSSIGGSKRTEIREEQVTNDLEAIRNLNEAVAFIKKTIEEEYNKKNPDMSIETFKNLIQDKIVNNEFGYNITNISDTYIIDGRQSINEDQDLTRVLEVTSSNYTQKVYITGMPSFLKYAVGSRGTLTLNGSTYIEEGNIYTNDGLFIANEAKYTFNGKDEVEKTTFPSVADTSKSLLFLEDKNIKYCSNNCYSGKVKNEASFHPLALNTLNLAFKPNPPTYSKENTEFVEVDIEKTFKEKLQVAGFVDANVDPYSMEVNEIIANGHNRSSVKKINFFTEIDNDPTKKGYLFDNPSAETYIDIDNLSLNKSNWLVINGSAIIENAGNQKMNVSANILITEDLTIRGDIAFDSTIYVRGKTTINNVNIEGLNNGELILLTQKELEIARINKFTNDINSIKAYLYTNENAEVYAMGSYLDVEGGIFAHGNLEINAYRGTADDKGTYIDFGKGKENVETASRLKIKNNKKLFINQAQGLPKIDKLEVVTDLMKKE